MPLTITSELYESDNVTKVADLDLADGEGWRDVLNEPGSGTIGFALDDPDRLLLTPGRIVRFLLDGTPRFSAIVPRPRTTLVGTDGEADEGSTFELPGLLALLDDALVEPELGAGKIAVGQRRFDWTSKDFDDSTWGNAVELFAVSATDVDGQYNSPDGPDGWPEDGPMRAASWIWSQAQGTIGVDDPPQPVGDVYLRRPFTLTDEALVGFFFTADDGYEVYVDGDPIAAELQAFAWGTARMEQRFLSAGEHTIAVRATNLDRILSSTNVAGFLFGAATMTAGGAEIDEVLVLSDSSWKALGYPAVAPTMTPGEILGTLITEAQTRGALPGVATTFTDSLDTVGAAWAHPVDLIVQVGASIGDVLRMLVETSIDVRVAATGLTLSVYNKGTLGIVRPADLSSKELLVAADVNGEDSGGTAALYQDSRGVWHWATAPGATRRKEVVVALGSASSDDQAARLIDALFARTADPTDHATYAFEPVAGAVPYVDFEVGDTVTARNGDDVPEALRVEALTVAKDETGFAVCAFEGRYGAAA